ncbi:MAG: methyltransferase domain-containing protein [Candidatus Bathyarchaeia archaeon]|jgi:cyclopropane fatty-acyl-phospholipid synthase-like methyltransferase
MDEHNLHTFAKYYDQIYLKRNDYKSESEVVQNIIKRFKRKPSKTLLDVGCGTGEHLKYLSQNFRCTGLDISRDMINTARAKVPNARFEVADMIDFRLQDRFDVITCLFSSIGYVQNLGNLARTLRNFYDHLTNDGLALVEPWVFKKDFRKGNFAIDTYEDERIKLARMGTSKLTELRRLVHFHYLRARACIRLTRKIHFYTLRHWKATMEYHRTKDILYVMKLLGHKNIANTLIYTQLVEFEGYE